MEMSDGLLKVKLFIGLFFGFVLLPVQHTYAQDAHMPNQQSATASHAEKKLIVKTTPVGITVQAEGADVYELFAKISTVTGIPIRIMDSDQKKRETVTISFENLPVQEAMEQILAKLSAGGLVTVSQKDTNAPITEIFVMTRQGTEQSRVQLKALRQRIINGEKLSVEELSILLIETHKLVGQFNSQEADIFLTPAYRLLLENFSKYRDLVFSILNDRDMSGGLRYAMLEIVGQHWEDPDSEKAAHAIFDNPAMEPPYLLGKSAKVLAVHKVDISDEILRRYHSVDDETKFHYVTALAYLDKKEAIPLLKSDLSKTENIPLRSSLIGALGQLDPDDPDTIAVLDKIVLSSSSENRSTDEPVSLDTEALSMQAVLALAQSSNADSYNHLLEAASNDLLPVDVRLIAIELLQKAPQETVAKVTGALTKLNKKIAVLSLLDDVDKERFSLMIKSVSEQLIKHE